MLRRACVCIHTWYRTGNFRELEDLLFVKASTLYSCTKKRRPMALTAFSLQVYKYTKRLYQCSCITLTGFVSFRAMNPCSFKAKRKSLCPVPGRMTGSFGGSVLQRQKIENSGGLGLPLPSREIVTKPKRMKKLFYKLNFLFVQMAVQIGITDFETNFCPMDIVSSSPKL